MKTQDLIEGLSLQGAQVPAPSSAGLRWPVLAAVVVSLLVCALTFGVDARWPQWLLTWPYAFKAGLALLVLVLASRVWPRLMSPGRSAWSALPWLAGVWALALLMAAGLSSSVAPTEAVFQGTWRTCALSILALSVPVWFALRRWARAHAPTQLRQTGAWMGALAASWGALVYSLHCTEFAPAFVAVWYGAALMLGASLSAWVAPRMLRW